MALVERKNLGGTCVNAGCTPTKALVASTKPAHVMRQAAAYGLPAVADFQVDLAAVMARKDAIVAASRQGLENWLMHLADCTLLRGTARFVSPTAMQVGEDVLEAEHIFLNMGARSTRPQLPGIGQVAYSKALDAGPTTSTSRWTFPGPANRLVSRTLNRLTAASLDECLNVHWFLPLTDAQEKIEHQRQEYNGFRPHSSLQNLTPDEVVAAATTVELQNA